MSDTPVFELGRVLTIREALEVEQQTHLALMEKLQRKADAEAAYWSVLFADENDQFDESEGTP